MRKFYIALVIIIAQYLLFFYPILSPDNVLTGSFTTDSLSLHYPSYFFLHEKLQQHKQFFWTERIYSGFPVYTDLERGFLNPINLLLLSVLDPFTSYKILHFIHYFVGAFFLYLFLKEKKIGLIGFAIANLTFFFSFYLMVRQELFNTVLIVYLLPAGLYLTEKLINTQKSKYAIFKGIWISSMIAWGQFNFITIILMIDALYLFIYSFKKVNAKKLIRDVLLIFLSALIICMPLIYPFLKMFLAGGRGGGDLTYTEGSYNPIVALTKFYPFVLGSPENYVGKIIKNEFYLNEIYTYLGISAILLSFLGLFSLKEKCDKVFYGLMLFSYVCLAFIEYVPILNKYSFPPITLFRYWGRASLFLTLSCSLLTAFTVQNISQIKINLKNLLILLPAFGLYLLVFIKDFNSTISTRVISHVLSGGIHKDFNFYVYIMIFSISLILIVASLLAKRIARVAPLLFAILVGIDLFVPSQSLSKVYYTDAQTFRKNLQLGLEPYKNTRVLYLNNREIFGNTMMYQPAWGLFGYSAPVESPEYVAYVNSLGFESVRRAKIDTPPNARSLHFIPNLQNAGITAIVEKDGQVSDVALTSALDLISNPISEITGSYLTKEEGNIKLQLHSEREQEIHTRLRNYEGWEIKINGKDSTFTNRSDELFLKFKISEGSSAVELKYSPVHLYKGVYFSLLLFGISVISYLLLPGLLKQKASN